MKRINLLLLIFSLCFVKVRLLESDYRLDIIHYNDFHARFEQTSPDSLICKEHSNCFGGFPRMFHEIEALRREKPNSILLNAGDSFQGTFWYKYFKWNATQYFMNLLPHDAHAIGNKDLDDGPQGLAPYLAGLKAPVLAANLNSDNEPILQGLYQSYIIIERDGRRIGIFGLITAATAGSEPIGNLTFSDPFKVAVNVSRTLTRRGVDIIILLSHCGYDDDVKIAREYGDYIDVIVGGHSHRDESTSMPYLTEVETEGVNKHKVIVVQARAFTELLGNLSVYYDDKGEFVRWEGGAITLDSSIPEDENIKAKIAPFAHMVEEAGSIPVGYTCTPMHYRDCLSGECVMGNFLVDVLNARTKELIRSNYSYITLLQRSNMRAIVPKGNITEASIVELFPYYDLIQTFELKGKHVLEALERGASDLLVNTTITGPWLLQVSGLQVTYNLSEDEGSRVASVILTEKNSLLDLEEYYQVTTPIFLAVGGDGYKMIEENKQNVQVVGYDQLILKDFIRQNSPINVTLDNRIIFLQ